MDSSTQELKKTPLHEKHVEAGAKMVNFAGYDMPVYYTSGVEEHFAVREKAGLFDVSHMGQFSISGSQAKDFLQHLTSNDVSKLSPGKAQYTCLPRPEGGIVDDMVLYKMAENDYLAVVNAANIEKDWIWFNQNAKGFEVSLENQSNEWALLALQGPLAGAILKKIVPDLPEVPFYQFITKPVFGEELTIISATGYTGSGGFELYVKANQATEAWDRLVEAGHEHGLLPCGLAARDTLRLEKGYMLYGNDITDDTSTLEAKLGWITKFNTDFIGKDFLLKQKEEGLTRKLVALEFTEKGIPRKDYPILNQEGQVIGKVTSGTQSPMLKKGIGLGYVQTAYSQLSTPVFVDCRGKSKSAEVVKLPFV